MATQNVTIHPFPTQGRASLAIISEEISRYAELSALLSQLEAEQKTFRAELLSLHAAGAQQGSGSPCSLLWSKSGIPLTGSRRLSPWPRSSTASNDLPHGRQKSSSQRRRRQSRRSGSNQTRSMPLDCRWFHQDLIRPTEPINTHLSRRPVAHVFG